MFKKKRFWGQCISIIMMVLLVFSTYAPVISAKSNSVLTDSPLNVQTSDSEKVVDSQKVPEEVLPAPVPETNLEDSTKTVMDQPQLTAQSKGSVVKGTEPIANTIFSIHTVEQQPKWYDFQTDENGQFLYNLPDGDYEVDGIWKEPTWYPVNKIFTIQNGALQGMSELVIDVLVTDNQKTPNLKGILLNGTDPLSSVTFSIHTLDGSSWYDTTTNQNGEFEFTLPDGSFQLDGIWMAAEGKWYELNQSIVMADGKLIGDTPFTVNIAQKKNVNVTGTLKKGNQVLANTIFSIHTTTGEEKWYDLQTDSNGAFGAVIPDGAYRLEGVWVGSEGKWYELKMNITVNGQLDWTIDLLTMSSGNVSGLLKKGSEALPNTIFSIKNKADGTWYDAQTNEWGYFDFHLPDGEYVLEGVWVASESKWYELKKSFTVQNHLQIDFDVLSPTNIEPNVFGVLKNGTTTLANITFSLHTTTPDQTWYDTTTDEAGNFHFTLPDGDYQIDGIWDPNENKWYELYHPFSVVNGKLSSGETQLLINVAAVTDNVTGTVMDANGVIANAKVYILQKSINYSQAVFTDATGVFSIQLEDDDYEIYSIRTEGLISNPVKQIFTVKNGKMMVDGVQTDSLTFTLPKITVQSILYDADGQVLQEQQALYISTTMQGETKNYRSLTNEGKASFRLLDGEYNAEYMYSEKFQSPIGQNFSVVNGQIFINGEKKEKLEIQLQPDTLQGQILDGDKGMAYAHIYLNKGSEANINPDSLYMTTADENGYFHLGLPDGVYNVLNVGDKQSITVDMTFEMIGGKLFVNGTSQDVLQISIPTITLHGNLSMEGLSNENVWIDLWNTDTGDPYSATTDVNGNFSLRLPDGHYKTTSIYHPEISGPILHTQLFTMVDGKLFVNDVQEETLLMKIGKLTKVKGHVQKSAGDASSVTGFGVTLLNNHYSISNNVQKDGTFELTVEDGSYQVNNLTIDYEYVPFDFQFDVVDGKLFVNGIQQLELVVKLVPVTLNGHVAFSGNDTPERVYVDINERTTNQSYYTWTDGSFALRLPDGQYEIRSVYLEDSEQWVTMNLEFSIENGKLLVNNVEENELVINILPVSLKGNFAFGYETLNKKVYFEAINEQTGDRSSIWTDNEGKFAFRLPDGQYRILHAYPDELKKYILITPIYFTISGGKLVVNGVNQPTLTIDLPKVQLITGRLMENDVAIKNATVRVMLDNINNSGTLPVTTDENGYFNVSLQDGKFSVLNVVVNNQTFDVKKSFEVVNGKVIMDGVEQEQLLVKLIPVNFQATILNEMGVPQKYVSVSVFGKSGSYSSYHPTTNSNGQISLRLADGDYEIGGLHTPELSQSIVYSLKFKVENGKMFVDGVEKNSLTITIPKLYEISVHMEKNGTPITEGAIFVGMPNGTVFSGRNFSNPNGDFTILLQNGVFTIPFVDQYGVHVNIAPIVFEVKDGKLYVDGVMKDQLVIK